MKYCSECGSKIEDETKFCPKCGSIFIENTSKEPTKEENAQITNPVEMKKNIADDSRKNNKKIKFIGIVAVFFIILFAGSALFAIFFYVQYTGTLSDYITTKDSYDSLTSDYNNLQNNYQSLESNYNSLQYTYNSLESSYNSYKSTVEVRYGQGADCEQFITSNDPSVISTTTAALGHTSDGDVSWDDMVTINNYIATNIKYNYDTFDGTREDCWLYPSETLSRGYGDCEDHALLMVSMCKAEGNAPWLWCATIKLQDGTGHMCVFIKVTGGQLFIFDPTSQPEYFFGFMIRGAWNSGTSQPVYQALQQYETECFNGQTITVLEIFNEQTYHTFNNNQEFSDFWI